MRIEEPLKYFRPSTSRSFWRNALLTALQTATLWVAFLWLVPSAITRLQRLVGLGLFDAGEWKAVVIFIFALAAVIGFYCGALFVKYGRGTPMPTDGTSQLVILGPYRFVRNPMAALGILQGVTVGVWMGSWPVICYAFTGGIAWHVLARPYEEADLERRFGAQYCEYRATIRNWVPRCRPYLRAVIVAEPEPDP